MPNERVVEIPWALQQLPQAGRILDVGSCGATYLGVIAQPDRELHCLDPRDCAAEVPAGVIFHRQSLIGNRLPRGSFDAVLVLSTLEHVGLPCYEQSPFPLGDLWALDEIGDLLCPEGVVVATMPAGCSRLVSWYRQYSPRDLRRLFAGWRIERIQYWLLTDDRYQPARAEEVETADYRNFDGRAGAVAGVVARPAP